MSTYPAVGNIARLSCAFTDSSGTPADPTTVAVTYRPPGGTPVSQTPVRDSVGAYHYDVQLTQPGTWIYRFIGTGAIVAQSGDQTFYVNPPQF